MPDNQKNKEKKWLFLAVGIVVGVVICCGVVVITELARNKSQSITQVIKHIYHQESGKDTVVKWMKVQAPKGPVLVTADSLTIDSALVDEQENWEEVDFAIEDEDVLDNDDVVIVEKIIAETTVKVHFKDVEGRDLAAPADGITSFQVQQWSTPIKNRFSYHRERNILKIKGLKIDKINIVSINKSYYLVLNETYYDISENAGFERLIPAEINH